MPSVQSTEPDHADAATVYENGVFRPLKRPESLAEHRRVTLTVTADEAPSSLADLAGRISPG